jgi:hypothetical protein
MSNISPDADTPPDDDVGYHVGYAKPPKDHQFKKGQSGNPKGRPKGSKNLKTILAEELDREVTVTQNGVPRKISKMRLAARQQADKAAKGDSKAFLTLAKLLGANEGEGGGGAGAAGFGPLNTGVSDEQYESALSAFLSRMNSEAPHAEH